MTRLRAWVGALLARRSAGTLAFARNVSVLVGSDLLVSVLTFSVTGLFIRTIGPEQFGIVNLVGSVAQFSLPFLQLGLPAAATYYLSRSKGDASIGGSALVVGTLLVITVWPLLWWLRDPIARATHVSPAVATAGIAYALPYALFYLGQGMLVGSARFSTAAVLNLASGLVFVAVACGMLLAQTGVSATGFIAASTLRWLLFGASALIAARALIGRPTLRASRDLVTYGGYYSLSALVHVFVLGSIDALMLNAWHGPATVGTYGAYYAVFNILVSRVMRQVSDVLMPTAAAHGAAGELLTRILRLAIKAIVPSVTVVAVLTFAVFRLYGEAYPFDWRLAIMMGAVVALHAVAGILGDLMNARGVAGTRASLLAAVATAIVNVTLNAALIPSFAIAGTMTASIAASCVSIALRVSMLKRLPLEAR